MKLIDVKSNTYIKYGKKINNKDPKFRIGDFLKTSKYKIFLQKVTFQIGRKKFL